MGIESGVIILKRLLAWAKNKDKRFPTGRDILPDKFKDIDPGELRRLERLVEKVSGSV